VPRARQSRHPAARHLPLGRGTPQRDPGQGNRRRDSFLASALAHQACRKGHRAGYRRASRLFHELALARADGTYIRLLAKLARLASSSSMTGGWRPAGIPTPDLLEILDDRYGTRSTIITGQLTPAQWHDYLGGPTRSATASCTTPTGWC
jgi:hypothetical protein